MKRSLIKYRGKKRETGQSGFTLIEVLIGVSILTVGLLGVATMQMSAIRGNHFSDSTTTALILAEQEMETLLNKSFDDDDLKNDEPANDNNLGSTTTVDHDERVDEDGNLNVNGYFRRIWNIDDDNPFIDNKTIRILVSWPKDSNQHRVFITSIKRP